MRRILVGWALVLTLGCGSSAWLEEEATWLDLASELDQAEIFVEAAFIDLGTPQARRHLGQGWSWNEKDPSGSTLVWSSRHGSDLHFFLARARPLTLRFRCKPLRQRPILVQGLRLAVNGDSLGEVPLVRGWSEYELELPAEGLRRGLNRLVFEVVWSETSGPVSPGKRRQVGIAWDWIRFPQIDAARRPTSTPDPSLVLTAGSQVDFYFSAPGETVLAIDRLAATGAAAGDLEISASSEGQGEPDSLAFDLGAGDQKHLRWRVTAWPGLARLTFSTTGDLELSRPRLLSAIGAAPSRDDAPPMRRKDAGVPRERPSLILLYLIDTLRADHLTPYHYERDTSPGLKRLARDGVVFEDMIAHSSWTKPTSASILTGQLPWSHGVEGKQQALSGEIPSLADLLRQAGFTTGGFSANGNVAEVFGFHHGFDHFSLMGQFDAPATEVHDQALRWLASLPRQDPVFLYVHTIDPHAPYVPTARFNSQAAAGTAADPVGTVPFMRLLAKGRRKADAELTGRLIDLYDGEIAFSDRQLTVFLDALQRSGLYDDALILVLSDHGEEFSDHGGWTHGRTLHREVLQVPLLIKFPGNWAAGSRVSETAQQIDLLPTILDYLDLPRPPQLPGDSLLCAVEHSSTDSNPDCPIARPRPVFASVHYYNHHWLSLALGDWKLILRGADRLEREAQLYRRSEDPEERHNLAARYPIRVGYLASLIRSELRRAPRRGNAREVELDEETRQRLEALGYLN